MHSIELSSLCNLGALIRRLHEIASSFCEMYPPHVCRRLVDLIRPNNEAIPVINSSYVRSHASAEHTRIIIELLAVTANASGLQCGKLEFALPNWYISANRASQRSGASESFDLRQA